MSSRALASALLLAALLAPPAHAAGDYRFEKQLDLAAGGTFSLRTEVGDVFVRGGEGNRAAVIVTSDRDDFGELFVTRFEAVRPDRVELVVERKSRGPASWFQSFRSHTRIEVTLPASAAAELAASGGRVEVSNLAGAVRAESSGGSLQATDLGGDATLSSSGGRVDAERIRGALTARSSGGGVDVRTIGGGANLESSGGPIEAEDVGGDLEASSSGGGVRIREARGAVVAGSSGGAVSVGFTARLLGRRRHGHPRSHGRARDRRQRLRRPRRQRPAGHRPGQALPRHPARQAQRRRSSPPAPLERRRHHPRGALSAAGFRGPRLRGPRLAPPGSQA